MTVAARALGPRPGSQRTHSAEELRELFHRKALAAERHRGAAARLLDLTHTEACALAHLARHGQLTPRELGDLLGLTSGGTTALVHRLEAAGHVTRRPHPHDRRSIILTSSASVRERAGKVYAPLVRDMDAVSAGFSPAERQVIGRYMAEIAAVSERHAENLATKRGRSRNWRTPPRAGSLGLAPGSRHRPARPMTRT